LGFPLVHHLEAAANPDQPRIEPGKGVRIVIQIFRLEKQVIDDHVVAFADKRSHCPTHAAQHLLTHLSKPDFGDDFAFPLGWHDIQAQVSGAAFRRVQAAIPSRHAVAKLIERDVLVGLIQHLLEHDGKRCFACAGGAIEKDYFAGLHTRRWYLEAWYTTIPAMTEHLDASLQTYLDAYLPQIEGVALSAGKIANHVGNLAAEERPAIAKAVEKRRWEFATGRYLARQGMQKIGYTPKSIRRDAERRPMWPRGCIGSITHAADLAVAAVAQREVLGGIGIDLEEADRVTTELYGKLFTDREQSIYQRADPRWPGLLFSAKEAAYKAVNPLVGKFIGFHEVEIDVDWQRRQFAIRYVGDHEPNSILELGEGHFGFFERYVFSLFIIP